MAVNEVIYNGETLINLTNDTVTPKTLAKGATAHNASGDEIAGEMPTETILYTEQTLTEAQKEQARENIGIDEEFKADITRMVIESLGGNPVFGYVDKNNNVILSGNLADGTYSIKYEMEDDTIDIGNLVLDTNVYYSVTSNLTNCKNNNSTKEVVEGESYSATITANDGYELKTVTVTMGGQPVSVSGGVINIASVTGNIVITAVAEEIIVVPQYTNLFNPSNATLNKRVNSSSVLTDASGHFVTDFIDISGKITSTGKIYIKGANFNPTSNGNNYAKFMTYKSKPSSGYAGYSVINGSGITVTDEGNGVISLSMSKHQSSLPSDIKYMVLVLRISDSTITSADIHNVVITIDEPIV